MGLYSLPPGTFEEVGLRPFDRDKVESAVDKTARQLGLSPRKVAEQCRTDRELRRRVVGATTNNESHFFRHLEQLELAAAFLERRHRAKMPSSVWSAGCARGEEVYSLAILLLERLGQAAKQSITLTGSDLSAASVRIARQGLYTNWSLRGAEGHHNWFRRGSSGHQVVKELLGWPEFHHETILEHLATMPPACLDVVLFRNVAIYFTPDALERTHQAIARVLAPEGLLIQAVTDAQPWRRVLEPHPLNMPGVYGRPGSGSRYPSKAFLRGPGLTTSLPKIAKSPRLPNDLHSKTPEKSTHPGVASPAPRAQRALLAQKGGAKDPGASKPSQTKPSQTKPSQTKPSQSDASALAERTARAQQHLDEGDPTLAADQLRAVLFAQPDDHEARYWYVLSLRACGRIEQATRQIQDLRRRLNDSSPPAVGPFETRELLASLTELEDSVS